VKGLEDETLEKAKEAARLSGLKVSAWIRLQVREAAERVEQQGASRSALDPHILERITNQLQEINDSQRAERERIERLQMEISEVIRAQHGMMSRLLSAS
jgi:hypothetical protein